MDKIITEKDYPIQKLWTLKPIIGSLFVQIFIIPIILMSSSSKDGGYQYIFIIYMLFATLIITPISTSLSRAFFHYSLELQFIVTKF